MAKILVVDDDPDFVEYTCIVLETHRGQVQTAATADSALKVMREAKPDVVLLDVVMSYARTVRGYGVGIGPAFPGQAWHRRSCLLGPGLAGGNILAMSTSISDMS
jgi:hypothetical protein